MITDKPKYYGNILAFDDKTLSISVDHFMHLKTYVISLQAKNSDDSRRITKRIKKIWVESNNITPLDEVMEVSNNFAFYATIKDNSYLILIGRFDEVNGAAGIITILGLIKNEIFTIKVEDDEGNVYKFNTLFNPSAQDLSVYATNSLEFTLYDL